MIYIRFDLDSISDFGSVVDWIVLALKTREKGALV